MSIFNEVFAPPSGKLPLDKNYYLNTSRQIVYIDVNELWPVAMRKFRGDQVVVSLKEKGMLYNPLTVLVVNKKGWELYKSEFNNLVDDPPNVPEDLKMNMIMCGCNRYYAAVELGYTHLPCIIATSWEDGKELCIRSEKDKTWKRDGTILPTQ